VPKLRKVSGEKVIRILCNKMGFEISGRTGSHVRLSKTTPAGIGRNRCPHAQGAEDRDAERSSKIGKGR